MTSDGLHPGRTSRQRNLGSPGVTGDAPAEHRMLMIYGDEDPLAVSGRRGGEPRR